MTNGSHAFVKATVLIIGCMSLAGCEENLPTKTQEIDHMKIGEIIGTAKARSTICFTGHPVVSIYQKNRVDELDPYRPLECLKYEDVEQMLLNVASGFDTYFKINFDASANVATTASFDLTRHDVDLSASEMAAIRLRPGLMRFVKTQEGWRELSTDQAANDNVPEYFLSLRQGEPLTQKFYRIERKQATASRWLYDSNGMAVGVQPISD